MRGSAAFLPLLLLLAGCAAPAAQETPPPTAHPAQPPAVTLVQGIYKWHEVPPPLNAYKLASQPVAHPCLYQGAPYFNNRQLPLELADKALTVPPGHLNVTLSWTMQDYPGKTLRVAYRAPGHDYQATPPMASGALTTVPVSKPANATADGRDWDLWLCIGDDGNIPPGANDEPGAVPGSVAVAIVWQADAR